MVFKIVIFTKFLILNRRALVLLNENHDIEDCTYYLQQTMEERSKFLFKNKLCYGCLKTVPKNIMQRLVQAEDLARCAMENM